MTRSLLSCLLVAVVIVPAPSRIRAQGAEPFYKGRTIELLVGYSAGGGYDTYARLLSRHIGKHIPGAPAVVPRNMEGAASLRLANWLGNAAPADGTVFGIVGGGVAFDPLLGGKGAQFDPLTFGWIGSANSDVPLCVTWHASGIAAFDDLLVREAAMGGFGPSSSTDQVPKIVNSALGTMMRVITGYPGGNEINLAMERGEVAGRCGWSWASIKSGNRQWVEEKKINLLFQASLEKHPDLPHVPLLMHLVKTDEHRQILKLIFAREVLGRPFVAPPNVPSERLATLRSAFNATMRDQAFLAEAEKARLEITPVTGEAIETLIAEVLATPPSIVRKAVEMINAK